ncbi:hypothetical protein D8I35_10095 [Corticibacter populi]|uniref:Plasmid recombination enzyme n=1 Tax=Corticibacter populi TaxID=1550736 RepID=A0A3M6QV30_9BURK|nr:plasmid recombination protein [Corticibacter populi]RMX06833.1 hypothetical protein D8I35_10095 [Corticibacter populi]RZS31575.1 plasmid recombination enzyme [Corticibacter populi]
MAGNSGSPALFMRVQKINSPSTFGAACRHNKREQYGKGIDRSRSHRNYCLTPFATARETQEKARRKLRAAGLGNGKGLKPLRKNAVHAVEFLFSLPSEFLGDQRQYFQDCLEWIHRHVCVPENVLSADVHLDEGAPHMHVIILPLIEGRMRGADVAGKGPVLRQYGASFFSEVASRHGLQRRGKAKGARRQAIIARILDHYRSNTPQILSDPTWPVIAQAIEQDPESFLGRILPDAFQPSMQQQGQAPTPASAHHAVDGVGLQADGPNDEAAESLCSVDFTLPMQGLAGRQKTAPGASSMEQAEEVPAAAGPLAPARPAHLCRPVPVALPATSAVAIAGSALIALRRCAKEWWRSRTHSSCAPSKAVPALARAPPPPDTSNQMGLRSTRIRAPCKRRTVAGKSESFQWISRKIWRFYGWFR